MNNPWEILGLDQHSATEREVKQAYARLIKVHRPDSDPAGFQRVRQAYEMALATLKQSASAIPQEATTPGSSADQGSVKTTDEGRDTQTAGQDGSPGGDGVPESVPPVLIEAEMAVKRARTSGDNEQLAQAISKLLSVCRELQPERTAIQLWQERLYRLLDGRADLLASAVKPFLLITEMENAFSVVTHAVVGAWSNDGNIPSLLELAKAMLANAGRLASEESAHVCLRLAMELAFTHGQTATQLIDLAFPHLDRQSRDMFLPQVEQLAAVGKLFAHLPSEQVAFWKKRFVNPGGEWNWTDQESQQAIRYLAQTRSSSWAGFGVIAKIAPQAWLVQLNDAMARRHRYSPSRWFKWRPHLPSSHRALGIGVGWLVLMMLSGFLRIAMTPSRPSMSFPSTTTSSPSFSPRPASSSGNAGTSPMPITSLQRAAGLGDVQAQVELGERYWKGNDGTPNPKEAATWFRQAAANGSVVGLRKLGLCYLMGMGVANNDEQGIAWIRRAAERDDVKAALILAIAYHTGRGVPKDTEASSRWCSKAAGLDPVETYKWLCLAAETDLPQTAQLRDELCQKLTSQQCAEGQQQAVALKQLRSGFYHVIAEAVLENKVQPLTFYSQPAQPNTTESAQEVREAADRGEPNAQNRLGDCYARGLGVTQDFTEAARWYQRASERGDTAALVNLALLHIMGAGVPKNEAEGVRLLRQAADRNFPPAQNELAKLCFIGVGVPKDIETAIQLHRKAAEQNNADSQTLLGIYYLDGLVVPKDEILGLKWLNKAIAQNHPGAVRTMALCYMKGTGVPRNEAEAIKWIHKAIALNDTESESLLAACYFLGHGVPVDYHEAVKWARRAAAKRSPTAQELLAGCYQQGKGVEQNSAEAAKWLRLAANQGRAKAQFLLGTMLLKGDGVPQNDIVARECFLKAAEQGHPTAQYMLSLCYRDGRPAPADWSESIKWLRKAAEQGVIEAQIELGTCYQTGKGMPLDPVEALKWHRQAAEQGSAAAQYNVGTYYANGTGVAKDLVEARKWIFLAASQNYAIAIQALSHPVLQLMPEQLAEAQRRAVEFRPKTSQQISPATPPLPTQGAALTEPGSARK